MTATTTPTAVWRLTTMPAARDGDSMYLLRERDLHRDEDLLLIQRDPKRVLCRAAWLACPEISGPNKDPINGPRATSDAQSWFAMHWSVYAVYGGPEFSVVQYGFEKYGRPLVDIRCGDQSFSQWMLTEANAGNGWPAYVG